MFYTNVDRVGSKLFHRYVDANGNRHHDVVKEFDFDVYLKSSQGQHRSLYGDPLHQITKGSIRELAEFVDQMDGVQPVFGQTDVVSQFIAKSYPGQIDFRYDLLRIVGLDIETRFDGYDPADIATVRRRASEIEEQWTVERVRAEADNEIYEVHDSYTGRWFAIGECPQLQPGGFPDPASADYEITTITLLKFGKRPVCVGTLDAKSTLNFDYIKVDNERKLLQAVIRILREMDPDVLTGWNLEQFDVTYLINRIEKVLGPGSANRLSPFHMETTSCIRTSYSSSSDSEIYKILGLTVYDYMIMYKTPSFNLENLEKYTLDFVAQHEGFGSKLEYEGSLMDLMRDDPQKYVEYNVQDVLLIERMENSKRFIQLAMTTILMTKSKPSDVFGKIKMLDNLIYNLALEEGRVIPPNEKATKREIIGAYVKEPLPGFYRWVTSLDLTSLYPSIAMMFNMSPETKLRTAVYGLEGVEMALRGETLDRVSPENCVTANGAVFRQDEQGVLPRAMKFVFDTRKAYKGKMIAAQKELEAAKADGIGDLQSIEDEVATYKASQGAMKILANSLYGCSAHVAFRYYDHDIAEGITITGQLVIRYIGEFINKYLNEQFGTDRRDYVITSDTDSCFLILDRVPANPLDSEHSIDEVDRYVAEKLQPAINEAYQELANQLGAKVNLLDMKREAISSQGFWRGKKNYALYMLDNEGVRFTKPKLKIMGLEPVRSDRAQVIRDALEESIRIILTGSNDELIDHIGEFRSQFMEMPITTVSIPKGVNNIEKYAEVSPGTVSIPWHVKAALLHNDMIEKHGLQKTVKKLRSGNKVYFAKLRLPNPSQCDKIAFADTLPAAFGLDDYIDRDALFDSFMTPVRSYCVAVGWKAERIASFDDLF